MKFRLYKSEDSEDSIVIEKETIEECQNQAKIECNKRNWKNAWSMEIRGD